MLAGPAIPLAHTNTDNSEFLTGEPISKPELIRQSDDANAMIASDSNIVVANLVQFAGK